MNLKELATQLNSLKMRFVFDKNHLRIISEMQGIGLYIHEGILHGYRLDESSYLPNCPLKLPVPITEDNWEWVELSIHWLSSKAGKKYILTPEGLQPRLGEYRVQSYPYYFNGKWYNNDDCESVNQ